MYKNLAYFGFYLRVKFLLPTYLPPKNKSNNFQQNDVH